MASIILGLLDLIIRGNPNPTEEEFVSTGAGQQGAPDVMEAVVAPMVGEREKGKLHGVQKTWFVLLLYGWSTK